MPPAAVRFSEISETSAASASLSCAESRSTTPPGPHDKSRRGSPKATLASSLTTLSAETRVRSARAACAAAIASATAGVCSSRGPVVRAERAA